MLIALIPTLASASDQTASIDFALQLTRLKVDLKDQQQTVNTTGKYIGITSFDRSEGRLQPGIAVGYAYVSIDQAVTAGMELEGFYIRPALRGAVVDTPHLSLTLTGGYLYQRVKDNNTNQAVTLEWYQPQLNIDALWRLTRQVGLRAGGLYGRIDADENLSGTINQSTSLKKGSVLGSYAGLEFDLGSGGQVGFLLHQGVGEGVELYFQRQF